MDRNILSLDFWQDTVTYEGHSMPIGTIDCAALNIPDAVIEKLGIQKYQTYSMAYLSGTLTLELAKDKMLRALSNVILTIFMGKTGLSLFRKQMNTAN